MISRRVEVAMTALKFESLVCMEEGVRHYSAMPWSLPIYPIWFFCFFNAREKTYKHHHRPICYCAPLLSPRTNYYSHCITNSFKPSSSQLPTSRLSDPLRRY